ncbi:MAG: hypothetical protein HONBIEJF_00459 [Fimbriimonadaceae bacterium]|nr:hypothetical protein [Fimbriimonadaceae bacterium]
MNLTPLVEKLVKNIVTEPESVMVDATKGPDGLVFNVTVSPNDVGKVIGKNGRVISAVRYVVSAAAAKDRQKAYVKVVTD